ncbi:Neocarzinostatin family protein [Promicromonospora umidemergens]|uniref:Neocarzinostatin family protein n=1 Tax=Promicromonospora umidemergens TaxID=629679 RepID=A0ABP8X7D5_9MICO|nr:neocarzinostatin apoprotein domain-containing protein [Promicromonospora umidemergens]MCP2281310.1 Neocarzinostatin family protein [Promicromonospora umidemergens]
MRARLLVPVAAVVLTLAACTAAPEGTVPSGPPPEAGVQRDPDASPTPDTPDASPTPGAPDASPTPDAPDASPTPDASGDPAITVRAADGMWVVHGTGFTGSNQYLVQCAGGTMAGASALEECDMSTSEQVVADERGEISATRPARAFVNVGAVSEVDCTEDPCALAVADLADVVLAAAAAPLPDGSEPPEAPSLVLSELELGPEKGHVTVTGTGYAKGSAVRIVQCATTSDGAVDGDNCLYDDGKRVVADRSGSVIARLPVQREIELVGGGVADCAVAGTCVVANAWTDGGRMALADLLWE